MAGAQEQKLEQAVAELCNDPALKKFRELLELRATRYDSVLMAAPDSDALSAEVAGLLIRRKELRQLMRILDRGQLV